MTKQHLLVVLAVLSTIAALILASWTTGGPPQNILPPRPAVGQDVPLKARGVGRSQLELELSRKLSGATLRGHVGRRKKHEIDSVSPDNPYRLGAVTKIDDDRHWKLEYYIPGTELLFEMPPVTIEWAGDLPVITISEMRIKGKRGTFRARILIDGDEYSGTWSDGKSNGCLFGVIVRDSATTDRET